MEAFDCAEWYRIEAFDNVESPSVIFWIAERSHNISHHW